MGKVRRCKRCGKDAWIVAEITPVIPPLCLPCFEHITGGEDFSRLAAAIRGFRSVRLAESENITLNLSWSQLQDKFRSFGAHIQGLRRNKKQDEQTGKDKFFKGSSQIPL